MEYAPVACGLIGRSLLNKHVQIGSPRLPGRHCRNIVVVSRQIENPVEQAVHRQIDGHLPEPLNQFYSLFKLFRNRGIIKQLISPRLFSFRPVFRICPALRKKIHDRRIQSSVPAFLNVSFADCSNVSQLPVCQAAKRSFQNGCKRYVLNRIIDDSQKI